jgi:hopanoid biosynthesis associated RND transporter like protein HpnN
MSSDGLKQYPFMYRWAQIVLSWPKLFLTLGVLLAAASIYYMAGHLTMNSNTADMVSPEASFQQPRKRMERLFPQNINTIVVVVESATPEAATQASKRLADLLRADTAHIESVYLPQDNLFFDQSGLLYLEPEELEKVITKLAESQPFFAQLAQDNSLHGLFKLLTQAVKAKIQGAPVEMEQFFDPIAATMSGVREGQRVQLSWQQLMLQDDKLDTSKPQRRLILVKPVFDFSQFSPALGAMDAIRNAAKTVQDPRLPEVQIRLTGEPALEHEELAGVSQGVVVGAAFSLSLVFLVLWIAFRSIRMMIATFVTLALGMIYSGGFAALAIGQLNLVSVAFAVSSIGLGVEYSIHFCLRFRDYLQRNVSKQRALRAALTTVGPSLLLCAFTTAIGLYAFVPTSYEGVSQLGLLAGTSLFLALLSTLIFLPALLRLMSFKAHSRPDSAAFTRTVEFLGTLPLRYKRHITYFTMVLLAGGLYLMNGVTVDFNPINLRDPNTESVRTFNNLLQSKDTSPMALAVLAEGETTTRLLQQRIEQRLTVASTISALDFVPQQQDEKLAILKSLPPSLLAQLKAFPAIKPQHNTEQAMRDLLAGLNEALDMPWENMDQQAVTRLRDEINVYLHALAAKPETERMASFDQLQVSVLGALPATIRKLQAGLEAQAITLASLPIELRERWLTAEGVYRIQVNPRENLNDLPRLQGFIEDVRTVAPDVTDLPVIYYESMNEVVGAFQQAFATALVIVALLLLLVRRSVVDMLLVMFPLLLTGLLTLAAMSLLHISLNFANIIVLPLLLGLGVDNGIHMVEKVRESIGTNHNIYESSTARGILYGSLAQIFGFTGLMFSPHQGVASMGMLISIGVLLIMWSTFVVLPALGSLLLRPTTALKEAS